MSKKPKLNLKNLVETDFSVRPGVIIFALFGGLLAGFIQFLNLMPTALTTSELSALTTMTLESKNTWGLILPDGISGWPYWLAQLQLITYSPVAAVSIFSALFSIGGLIAFYQLLRMWFGRYDAVWGVLLLATNTAFLVSTFRVDIPFGYIVLALSTSLIGLSCLYRKQQLGYIWSALAIGLSLYAGLWGWLLAGLSLSGVVYSLVRTRVKLRLRTLIISLLTLIVFLLPVIRAWLIEDSSLLFGSAQSLTPSISNLLESLQFIIAGSYLNQIGLAATWPLLSIAELTLIVLSLLLLKRKSKAIRYPLITGLLISSIAFTAILGPSPHFVAFFLPLTTILVIAAGRYLRDRWYALFPNNSTARMVSRFGMYAIFLGIIALNTLKSYVYWPHLDAPTRLSASSLSVPPEEEQ